VPPRPNLGPDQGLSRSPLLHPYRSDALSLPNRIAMAPMTRGRSDDNTGVPHPAAAVYYAQRAAAGMIVTEGTWPEPIGKNGPGQPGLATAAQVEGWRRVTTTVHAAGGTIFAQLWHAGRVSHPRTLPGGRAPLAPSEVAMQGPIFTRDGWVDPVNPHPLSTSEITSTVEAYATAARNAISAGFDGVELHGANGYLIHQFLADNTNLRTDGYGGSLTGRLRFAVEVVDAVAAAVGSSRLGLRLSPGNPINEVVESDPAPVYHALIDALRSRDLAYLHLVEAGGYPALEDLRPRWPGTVVGNLSGERAMSFADGERLLNANLVDVLAYGRLFLANPDLPLRLVTGAPLAQAQRDHHYASTSEGYIDHPFADPELTCLAQRLIHEPGEGDRNTGWA
jgi:N-ethylmaleimide reductase